MADSFLTPEQWTAVLVSVRVASVAMLGSFPFAVAIAYVLARKSFPGKTLLDALVHLPLVMPPVATGLALLFLFGRRGPLGQWLEQCCGISLVFSWTGAALAASIMAFPLLVRPIRQSLERLDRRHEQAAALLGAAPATVFFRVVLPLIAPGVLAGLCMAFAKALGEFGASATFVASIPGQTQTISSEIYASVQTPGGDGSAMRLALVAAALAMGATIASEYLKSRLNKQWSDAP